MKKLLLNFLLLSIFVTSFAQNKGTINYKLTTKTSFGKNEVNKIIYFYGHQSIEFYLPKIITPSSEQKSETEFRETKVINSKKKPFLYKNLKAKELILRDNIFIHEFLIKDTLNNFTWKIKSDHKQISNYSCTKATLNFRGRDYVLGMLNLFLWL